MPCNISLLCEPQCHASSSKMEKNSFCAAKKKKKVSVDQLWTLTQWAHEVNTSCSLRTEKGEASEIVHWDEQRPQTNTTWHCQNFYWVLEPGGLMYLHMRVIWVHVYFSLATVQVYIYICAHACFRCCLCSWLAHVCNVLNMTFLVSIHSRSAAVGWSQRKHQATTIRLQKEYKASVLLIKPAYGYGIKCNICALSQFSPIMNLGKSICLHLDSDGFRPNMN